MAGGRERAIGHQAQDGDPIGPRHGDEPRLLALISRDVRAGVGREGHGAAAECAHVVSRRWVRCVRDDVIMTKSRAT
jgi:hypothetical protein